MASSANAGNKTHAVKRSAEVTAETLKGARETRIQVLERGLEHSSNSQKIGQALQVLREQE